MLLPTSKVGESSWKNLKGFPMSLGIFTKTRIYAHFSPENPKGGSLGGGAYDIWTRDVDQFPQHDESRMHEVFCGQLDTLVESQWMSSWRDPAQEGCLLGQQNSSKKSLEVSCSGQRLRAESQGIKFRVHSLCWDTLQETEWWCRRWRGSYWLQRRQK